MYQRDKNTKFFYSVVKTKQARNQISHLINDKGEMVTNMIEIKTEAPAFFERRFNQTCYWNVFPQLIIKRKIIKSASSWLSRNVANKEITDALKQMHPDKALSPDGFNAYFFQSNWEIIGSDVCRAVHSFFNSGRMLSEVNHTFNTLVPKSTNASHLSDFRPISCNNTLYKLISKILANRLQKFIGELISHN